MGTEPDDTIERVCDAFPNNLFKLSKLIHQLSTENGFNEVKLDIPKSLMIIVGELGEALDADRKDKYYRGTETSKSLIDSDLTIGKTKHFESFVKDTFQDKIIDSLIGLLVLAESLEVDLDFHIKTKLIYNRFRPCIHGKKY